MKRMAALALLFFVASGAALAQDATPSPAFGPVVDGPAPVSIGAPDDAAADLAPTVEASPGADARLTSCGAPALPDFVPYTVRAGDRLGDLLTGVDNLTVSQLALLNCLDDPGSLPVGATIWVPRPSSAGAAVQPEGTEVVSDEEPIEQAGGAAILSLEASADTVPNLEGVAFQWDARGAEAYFYPCPADAGVECRRPMQAQPLPTRFTYALDNFHYAGPARFRLDVVGGGERVTEDIVVQIECSNASLGLATGHQSCPQAPPSATFGVWQPFENGVMLYFEDTGEIYVMTNADNRVQVFADTFQEGMQEPAYADVPSGRFPARRGFGLVWSQLGGPQSPLGWALAEEIGFESARQPAGRVSFTTYTQGPGDVVYAVTLAPDSGQGYWSQIKG